MAHRIIGYFETAEEIIGKTFWLYYYQAYVVGVTITDITPKSGSKWAIAVWAENDTSPAEAGKHRFSLGIIAQVTEECTVTYEEVCKYDGGTATYGTPPKPVDAEFRSVLNWGPWTLTLTPPSQSGSLYPYTYMIFSSTMANWRYIDSDGCPYIYDENGLVNNYGDNAIVTSTKQRNYVMEIMGHPAVPPKGQGTVTLEIPANGANLTFKSALLGVSVTKMISKDAVVDMEDE